MKKLRPLDCPRCGNDMRTHRGACPRCAIHGATITRHRRRQARRYGDPLVSIYCITLGAIALRFRGGL